MDRLNLAQRLRDARDLADLTQERVAEYLGVRRPAIAEIEAGTRAVKSNELVRLADLYGKTLRWLLEGTEARGDRITAALFRTDQPADPLLRREAAKLARRCRMVFDLEKELAIEGHHDSLPTYHHETALTDYSLAVEHGRRVAYLERARLGLGVGAPIRDPWGVVEDAGLHVFPIHLGRDAQLDGIFTRPSEGQACVGVNVDKWVFRQVFTVVHELGHALMDGDTIGEACVIGRAWDQARSTYANRELRANQFAAVFLVPREALIRYLRSRERIVVGRGAQERTRDLTPIDIVRAQDHFGVSADMLLWRLVNESLLEIHERHKLAEQISRIGVLNLARSLGYNWRERAQPVSRAQELGLKGYSKGAITLGQLAEIFDKTKEEMYDLLQVWGVHQDFAPGDALVGATS